MAGTPRRRPARSSAKGAARRPRATRPAGRAARDARKRAVTGNPAPRESVMTPRRWMVLVSLTVLLAIMLVPTVNSWYEQQQRLDELHQEVASQKEHVKELRRERELWETDAYVESQARKRLKFVMPGERSYTVVDPEDEEEETTVDPETGAVTAPDDQPWYEKVSSSVQAADDPNDEK